MLLEFPSYIHFIGIKGSGMTALATLLSQKQHIISGSDIADIFYTDKLLQAHNIPYCTTFSPNNIPAKTQLVIYSAAYSADSNTELAYAQKNYSCLSYPQALGLLSQTQESWAVIGTHGKTTTSSMIGILCKAHALPVSIITGSSVPDFNDNASWCGTKNKSNTQNNSSGFFAEVCEYKNHFNYFKAFGAIFTNAEYDHPDFFKDADAVYTSFATFLSSLSNSNNNSCPIIACYDDVGVHKSLEKSHNMSAKTNKQLLWYGFNIPSALYKKSNIQNKYVKINYLGTKKHDSRTVQTFSVCGLHTQADELTWYIPMPSKIMILNAVAALTAVSTFMNIHKIKIDWNILNDALYKFKGITRRSQIIYADNNINILDDYAHHPTAIKKTLSGIKNFYNPKRLIVAFMSHTYSRTDALWKDFCTCFSDADEVIINKIYSSARNDKSSNKNHSAQTLAKKIALYNTQHNINAKVSYIDSFEKSINYMYSHIQTGDVFVTMGAGDNFRISHALKTKLEKQR